MGGRRSLPGWLAVGLFVFLIFCIPPAVAMEDDREVSLAEVVPEPYIYFMTPEKGMSYDDATRLTVKLGGQNVNYYELELIFETETLRYSVEAAECEYIFTFDEPQTQGATLVARGYSSPEGVASGLYAELKRVILSPKAELIEKMIALAYDNSQDKKYKFAPAQEDGDIGVCKNFVMRLFNTFSKGSRMPSSA